MAAVAAGWASLGNELFPAEGHAAVPAVAGLDADSCFINEHFPIFSVLGCALHCCHSHRFSKARRPLAVSTAATSLFEG